MKQGMVWKILMSEWGIWKCSDREKTFHWQFHNSVKTFRVQKGRENYCTTSKKGLWGSALHCTEDSVAIIPAFQYGSAGHPRDPRSKWNMIAALCYVCGGDSLQGVTLLYFSAPGIGPTQGVVCNKRQAPPHDIFKRHKMPQTKNTQFPLYLAANRYLATSEAVTILGVL